VKPVLDTCEWAVDNGIHLELTNLIIPDENDDPDQIRELCRWIAKDLNPDVPIHFSRFHPMYKMSGKPSTPVETIEMALEIAEEEGLNYVYVGNVPGHRSDNTYCPECGKLLIKRSGFSISEYNLEDGERCKHELRTLAATGRRSVPAWIDRDAIDGLLGAHTEGSPRLVATDGGEVLTADAAAEERPDACECSGHERETLPCWYCYAEGFDEPNPAPASD